MANSQTASECMKIANEEITKQVKISPTKEAVTIRLPVAVAMAPVKEAIQAIIDELLG